MQSRVIDTMRFPLAAMVVLLHSQQIGTDYNLPNWTNMSGEDIFTAVNIFFSHALCHVAVPVFFVISGYLFFYGIKKFDGKIYFDKLKKRSRFIIPYLLWNLSVPLMGIVACIIRQKPVIQALTAYRGGYFGIVTFGDMAEKIGWERPCLQRGPH